MKAVFDITIDFEKSKGSYLYDKNTEQSFLDLFSMFSSLPLGYNHSIFNNEYDKKMKQITHLRMSNNLFYSDELKSFKERFLEISFHNNLHFCSTGALAVEAAIKCGYEYKKNTESVVYSLKNSFHGINSWGFTTDSNISSVKNRVIHYPQNNWKKFSLNELIDALENIDESVSSVIIEPIQCTAGDIYLDNKKLKKIQNLCNKNNICFIVDEVQTGFGSTGEYWYSKKINLKPDIIVFGKKSQICGIMTNDKYSEAIHSKYRKLEVTFDGELIDAIRSEFVMKAIEKQSLLDNVNKVSKLFKKELSQYFQNYRSAGNLIAFDLRNKEERDAFFQNSFSNKLLVNPTGDISIRMRPNLSISDDEVHDAINRIRDSI
jgi:L-lysine 6-transaminase